MTETGEIPSPQEGPEAARQPRQPPWLYPRRSRQNRTPLPSAASRVIQHPVRLPGPWLIAGAAAGLAAASGHRDLRRDILNVA